MDRRIGDQTDAERGGKVGMSGSVQECGYTSGGQEDGEGGEILDR